MLVEQVDDIGLESLERSLGDLLDVLRPTIEPQPARFSIGLELDPNLVAITTRSRTEDSASPTSSSFVSGP